MTGVHEKSYEEHEGEEGESLFVLFVLFVVSSKPTIERWSSEDFSPLG